MRKAISTDSDTGTSRWQEADVFDISFHESLGCTRRQYERVDIKQSHVVKSAEAMASVSWSTAKQLEQISDCAFAIEAHRRGMRLVSVENILSQENEIKSAKSAKENKNASSTHHNA